MRKSDIMVLPSIEEGFALVCAEAMGSGSVPLVSEACTDLCRHMHNAMVHRIADVDALTSHLTLLHQDRTLLAALQAEAARSAAECTWSVAGQTLLNVYRDVVAGQRKSKMASDLEPLSGDNLISVTTSVPA
jgi:glycosyltransferase involved in cell wall biosynthesis